MLTIKVTPDYVKSLAKLADWQLREKGIDPASVTAAKLVLDDLNIGLFSLGDIVRYEEFGDDYGRCGTVIGKVNDLYWVTYSSERTEFIHGSNLTKVGVDLDYIAGVVN